LIEKKKCKYRFTFIELIMEIIRLMRIVFWETNEVTTFVKLACSAGVIPYSVILFPWSYMQFPFIESANYYTSFLE